MSYFFFFKQKTAYEMRISDWSSDVCSSDLREPRGNPADFTGDQFIAEDRDDARQRAHPAQAFAARSFAAPAHRLGPGEGADDRGERFGQHNAGRAAGTLDHSEIHAVAVFEPVLGQHYLAQAAFEPPRRPAGARNLSCLACPDGAVRKN